MTLSWIHTKEEALASTLDTLYKLFPNIPNKIIADIDIHQDFGAFRFSPERTGVENTDRIQLYNGFTDGLLRDFPPEDEYGSRNVTSISHDEQFTLPSRELLEMRAAIAKVLHAPGMGEKMENITDTKAEIGCLA
ncbi:hypothetical protein F5884DRAFT_836420 [Xylogone sp. PMI_703]|nr:hypothetical protein F5884DRAFT_836420 [Xylogone sp. PMI_703]